VLDSGAVPRPLIIGGGIGLLGIAQALRLLIWIYGADSGDFRWGFHKALQVLDGRSGQKRKSRPVMSRAALQVLGDSKQFSAYAGSVSAVRRS